jgi:hypothetical protein
MIELFDFTRIDVFELCDVFIIVTQFIYFYIKIDEVFVEAASFNIRSLLHQFFECREATLAYSDTSAALF